MLALYSSEPIGVSVTAANIDDGVRGPKQVRLVWRKLFGATNRSSREQFARLCALGLRPTSKPGRERFGHRVGKNLGAGRVPARVGGMRNSGRDTPCPYGCPNLSRFDLDQGAEGGQARAAR